jgi:hypothetical protein
MPAHPPVGDLARAFCHEANDDWPAGGLEIVAYPDAARRKSRRIRITADQFFGRGGHGAPMGADQLFQMIERLRKAK